MYRSNRLLVGVLFIVLYVTNSSSALLSNIPLPYWVHQSSINGDIPLPTQSPEQTATLIADFDGNGLNDIIVGSRQAPGPSLVWLRWDSGEWHRYVVEDDVLNIEAGGAVYDIDGDGDLDIVMGGDHKSNQVWWWENPSPLFSPETSWVRRTIKNQGEKIHHDQLFGDFDHDGQVELIFWNQGSWNASSGKSQLMMAELPSNLKTADSWSFTSIFTGFGEGLAAGDVNLDGKVDLIAGGYWFEYHSDGRFTPYAIDPDYGDTRVAVGEMTEDGRLSVFMVRGDGSGPLNQYHCTGDPTQATCWQKETLLPLVEHGHSLAVADLNADAYLDVFVGEMRLDDENPDATLWALLGHGNGTYTETVIATGFGVHEAKVGDINGDGTVDIVAKPFNWQTPRLDFWFNVPTNPFDEWERVVVDVEKPEKAVFVKAADLNGDGLKDIVTGGWWYANPGVTGDNWARNTIGSPLNDMTAVFDIDGDGDVDILGSTGQGSKNSTVFVWAENDGNGQFNIHQNITQAPSKGFIQGVSVVDIDNDGSLNVLLSWNGGVNGIQALSVPDEPTAVTWPMKQLSPTSQGEQIDTGDIDNDGDLDILLGTVWLEQNGTNWSAHNLYTPTDGEPDRVQLADMDGDGDLDSVVGYAHGTQTPLAWYEQPNTPTQPWQEHIISWPIGPLSIDVVDYDGDGDVDVMMGEHNLEEPDSSRLIFYENLSTDGTQWRPHQLSVGDEHHDGTQMVDMDNDGDLDVISIGWTHGRVLLYTNNDSGESILTPPPPGGIFTLHLPMVMK